MQCPQCNAVVIAGSSRCLYCHTDLTAFAQPKTESPKTESPRFSSSGSRDLRSKFAHPGNPQHLPKMNVSSHSAQSQPHSSQLQQANTTQPQTVEQSVEDQHNQGPLKAFLAKGERLEGKFQLMEEIGRGGMGVVYRGIDISLNREIAVKVLPPHYNDDESVVGRFRREARAMASLDHSNIVTVYSIGYEHGLHYFAMKLLHGETLAHTLKKVERGRRPPLSVEEVIDLLVQACNGLEHAHSKSLLHRDIKPGNLMLSQGGGLTIMDFGIVKDLGDSDSIGLKTAHGKIFGTPEYMPPEQAMGKGDYSPASDLYALAVVGYELLCGELPYTADTPIGIIIQHIRSEIPPLKGRAEGQYPIMESIFRKALAKEANERYESAAEFRIALLGAKQTLSTPQLSEFQSGSKISPAEQALSEMIAHSDVQGLTQERLPQALTPASTPIPSSVPSSDPSRLVASTPASTPATAHLTSIPITPEVTQQVSPSLPNTPPQLPKLGNMSGDDQKPVELQRASKRAGHYTMLRRKK